MQLKMVFVLIVMLIVALFSVQNADVITVRFLGWEFMLSQALVIMLGVTFGVMVGLVLAATGRRRPEPAERIERFENVAPPPPTPPPPQEEDRTPTSGTGR